MYNRNKTKRVKKMQEDSVHFSFCGTNSAITLETLDTKVVFYGQNMTKSLKSKENYQL